MVRPPDLSSLPLFGGAPLELDIRSITQTTDRQPVSFDSSSAARSLRDLSSWQRYILLDYEEQAGVGVGFTVQVFPSGEVTAACYSKGIRQRPPKRAETLVTTGWSRSSKQRVRRSVENSKYPFLTFVTFTFDPSKSELDTDGRVCQKWANKEMARTLATISKRYSRLADKLNDDSKRCRYVCVKELQQNGNIHFHVLTTKQFIPVKWLVDVWGQSSNSVNIKPIKDSRRAVNYLTKYMSKETGVLIGKRYWMSSDLVADMKPQRFSFYGREKRMILQTVKDDHRETLLSGRGYVGDWGVTIPAPTRPVAYRNRDGEIKQTQGISRHDQQKFLADLASRLADQGEYSLQTYLQGGRDTPF